MSHAKLFLDTNIVIDYLNERDPFYESARLLMIAGRVGELNLWISSSQVTDLIYILSEGGKAKLIPEVLNHLRGLRTFVNIAQVGSAEIDAILNTAWADPEDALLYEVALKNKADFFITRNPDDFENSVIPIMSCQEFLGWLSSEKGINYAIVTM